MGPERSVFAITSLNRRDYRDRQPLQPERDSRGYRIEAGASFMLTPLIRSRISAGYFAQDFDSPFFSAVSGLAFRGRLDYRSEEHTSELQSLMRNSFAVFCLKKKNNTSSSTTVPTLSISRTYH